MTKKEKEEKPVSEDKTDTKNMSLTERMRHRLNVRAGKKITLETAKTGELVQVEAWLDMPPHFRRAVGAPGFPVGHISQIIGESDTGKTTELMLAMIQVQRSGGVVYLIDSEHKFSFERFRLMGGIPEEIIIVPADTLEEVWNHNRTICEDVKDFRVKDKETPILIAWDSVAASVPDAMEDAEAEDQHVSLEAKINNKEIRKMRAWVRKYKICAVFINHSYWTMPKYGAPKEVIKGGAEMYFMSTLIIKTKRRGPLDRDINNVEERIGAWSILEVFKGHLGGSKAKTEFYIVGQGVLETVQELKDYKDLILKIEGPDINKLTLAELTEIRTSQLREFIEKKGGKVTDSMTLAELRTEAEKFKKKKDVKPPKKGDKKKFKKAQPDDEPVEKEEDDE